MNKINNKHIVTDIFFDLDHTLWDFDKNSMLAFERVFKKHDINIEITDFIKEYEPINFNYWKLFREDKVTKIELRRGRLMDVFSIFNLNFNLENIDILADSYIEELPGDNHLFNGAEMILNYLSNKYILHIITNGFEEVQQGKMDHSNISHFFKTVTNSEMVGVKKPDPKIFYFALDLANATPENSVMIGDNYEADILGALSIGMEALCFNYHKEELKPHIKVIENLNAIKNYL